MEKKAESCLKNDAGGENCHLITGQEIIQTEQCARKKFWRKLRSKIKENLLLLLTLCGVLVGFGLGFGLRRYELSDSGLMWLGKYMYTFEPHMHDFTHARQNGHG